MIERGGGRGGYDIIYTRTMVEARAHGDRGFFFSGRGKQGGVWCGIADWCEVDWLRGRKDRCEHTVEAALHVCCIGCGGGGLRTIQYSSMVSYIRNFPRVFFFGWRLRRWMWLCFVRSGSGGIFVLFPISYDCGLGRYCMVLYHASDVRYW